MKRVLNYAMILLLYTGMVRAGTEATQIAPAVKAINGTWVVTQCANAHISTWLDSELKACIGCKLTISGERAEFHCPRNAYKALLTNPKVISKKVQGYWMFEQNNPKTRLRIIGTKDRYLEPKTLGIQGDRDLVLIDSPKGFPFSLTVANAGQRLMFGIDGGYFLLDRVKNRQ